VSAVVGCAGGRSVEVELLEARLTHPGDDRHGGRRELTALWSSGDGADAATLRQGPQLDRGQSDNKYCKKQGMPDTALSFTINGARFTLRPSEVRQKMAKVAPEPLRDHGVKIDGKIYPVKQVVSEVTGLDRLDFQSMQARSVLKRLGLELWRSSGGRT
jgi:hypothetical protein